MKGRTATLRENHLSLPSIRSGARITKAWHVHADSPFKKFLAFLPATNSFLRPRIFTTCSLASGRLSSLPFSPFLPSPLPIIRDACVALPGGSSPRTREAGTIPSFSSSSSRKSWTGDVEFSIASTRYRDLSSVWTIWFTFTSSFVGLPGTVWWGWRWRSAVSSETSFSMGCSSRWLVSFKAATWSLTPDASHATANIDRILVTRIVPIEFGRSPLTLSLSLLFSTFVSASRSPLG